jgi:CRISPR-associated protein Csd2
MDNLEKRYDFIYLFDVKDGNPNGDPDAGNLPRIDAETGNGLVTDVCLKRKVRNYVQLSKNGQVGYDIFVKEKAILNNLINGAYGDLHINLAQPPKDKKDGEKRNTAGKGQGSEIDKARIKMCEKYFDIRAFGAVLSTGPNAGQVRGPVQLTFARSVGQVVSLEHSITRMAVTTEEDAIKQSGDNRTMGRKFTIPYGLYQTHGFISAPLANQTGFSQEDLALFWEALQNMFEHDRSAARGLMSAQRLIIFEHASPMGNKPVQELFGRLAVEQKDKDVPARSFSDYKVLLDGEELKEFKKIVPVK